MSIIIKTEKNQKLVRDELLRKSCHIHPGKLSSAMIIDEQMRNVANMSLKSLFERIFLHIRN